MVRQDLLGRRSPRADGCRYGLVQKRELGNVAAVAVNGPAPVAGKHGLLDPNPPGFVGVAWILVLNGAPPNQEFSNLCEGLRTRPFPRLPLHRLGFKNGSKGLPVPRLETQGPSDEDKI